VTGPIRRSTEETIFREEANTGKEKDTCIASSKVLQCRDTYIRMSLLIDTLLECFQSAIIGFREGHQMSTKRGKYWMKSVKQSWNKLKRNVRGFFASLGWSSEGTRRISRASANEVPAPLTPQRRARLHCPSRHPGRNNNRPIGTVSVSGIDRRHNCSRCGKSYKNAYILKRHLLYECGMAPSFNCPHCAFSSKYERNLKAHINHRHVASQSAGTPVNQRA
ncbi:unnamed protein product, partial [Heterotrigona itama]